MGLALVRVHVDDFDLMYDHLSTHKGSYRNMHLREACQRNKVRDLRYLHAMYAKPEKVGAPREVEGMISGPGVFWHYALARRSRRVQLNVLAEEGSQKAFARIEVRFLSEILDRIAEEQSSEVYYPKRTTGQFYLRRGKPGMLPTHSNCKAAVAEGVLDLRFVSKIGLWGFALLHP